MSLFSSFARLVQNDSMGTPSMDSNTNTIAQQQHSQEAIQVVQHRKRTTSTSSRSKKSMLHSTNLKNRRNLREKRRPTGVELHDGIHELDLVRLQKLWRQSSSGEGSDDEDLQEHLQQQVQDDDEDLTPQVMILQNTRFNEMISFCTSSLESIGSSSSKETVGSSMEAAYSSSSSVTSSSKSTTRSSKSSSLKSSSSSTVKSIEENKTIMKAVETQFETDGDDIKSNDNNVDNTNADKLHERLESKDTKEVEDRLHRLELDEL